MNSTEFQVDTGGRMVTDITDRVQAFARDDGSDGLVLLFLPHATAGLALMETGSGSEADLLEAVERLVPRGARYAHRHGAEGHGGDHLLPAFVSPSLVLAVEGGQVVLGTWQSIVVVDPNRDNNRRTVQVRLVQG
jgi:secondary thiamine-phosphate synthase enzyme